MKHIKSGITFVLALSMISTPQQAQAFNYDDAKNIAGIAAVAVTAGGIGYGCYRLHEIISLYDAQNRLKQADFRSASIIERPHYTIHLNEQELVSAYYDNIDQYTQLCGQTNRDAQTLANIQAAIDADISYWATTDRAYAFLTQARAFSDINNQRLQQLTHRAHFLNKQLSLMRLARMLDEETRTANYPMVYAATQRMLDEPTARSYNPQSAWPLRVAWKNLEQRKQLYQQCISEYGVYDARVDYVNTMIQTGRDTIAAYDQAQRAIAGFKSYTDDFRAEKDFEIKEEQARQARIQAEAARLAAIAQQQQAQAQEKQIKQQKENELIALRNELSMIKQRIANGDNSYYLRQQKTQLQHRISQIKTELYGPSSWGSFFCDVLTDQD